MGKVMIVLPAYNEENSIRILLEDIHEIMKDSNLKYKIIVVDDGSIDKTVDEVKSVSEKIKNVTLISHSQNKGLGEALKTGLLHTVAEADLKDIIVTMDADNTHPPGLILRMVRMIQEGNDVVIASRYLPESRTVGIQMYRKFLTWSVSILLRILFSTKGVKDFTSGFRAYRAGVLQKAFEIYGENFISKSGFSCMVEILLKLRRMNIIINEAPLILRYDKKFGKSKMNIINTIKETLYIIFTHIIRFK